MGKKCDTEERIVVTEDRGERVRNVTQKERRVVTEDRGEQVRNVTRKREEWSLRTEESR